MPQLPTPLHPSLPAGPRLPRCERQGLSVCRPGTTGRRAAGRARHCAAAADAVFPPLAHRSLRSYCVVVFTLHGIVRMRARPRVCVRAQALSGLGFRVWAATVNVRTQEAIEIYTAMLMLVEYCRAQALSDLGFRVWAVADAKKLRLTFAHGPAAPAPPPLA